MATQRASQYIETSLAVEALNDVLCLLITALHQILFKKSRLFNVGEL